MKGDAKVEFFTNIDFIRKEYEKGLVVSKFLYEKVVQEKGIKMRYATFNNYFNKYINTLKISKDSK